MNELIRTLARQAEEYAEVRYDRFRETPMFNTCRDTKFAELIVRECIAQCNDGDSRWFIAQHFGVEE